MILALFRNRLPKVRVVVGASACVAMAVLSAGCPPAQGEFTVRVINATPAHTVSSVRLARIEGMTTSPVSERLFDDIGPMTEDQKDIRVSTARNADANTITVEVEDSNGDYETSFTPSAREFSDGDILTFTGSNNDGTIVFQVVYEYE
jgi:hypothetical protein